MTTNSSQLNTELSSRDNKQLPAEHGTVIARQQTAPSWTRNCHRVTTNSSQLNTELSSRDNKQLPAEHRTVIAWQQTAPSWTRNYHRVTTNSPQLNTELLYHMSNILTVKASCHSVWLFESAVITAYSVGAHHPKPPNGAQVKGPHRSAKRAPYGSERGIICRGKGRWHREREKKLW